MAKMQIERLGEQTIACTGWKTTARCCPLHGSALELTFDETDYSTSASEVRAVFHHDDNRVRWRCATCVGSYSENYFLYRWGFQAPQPRRLLLRCPHCASLRVTHECVPDCCSGHSCLDCRRGFEARLELITRGRLVAVGGAEQSNAADAANHDLMMSVPGPPEHRSGITREFRRCPAADHHSPLELVFLTIITEKAPARSEPMILGWYCLACDRAWTESWFRPQRRGFIPEATPAALCETCRSTELVSAGEDGRHASCTNCGSEFLVHLDEK